VSDAAPSIAALVGAAVRDLVRDGATFARLAVVPFAWTVATGLFFELHEPDGPDGWFRLLRLVVPLAGGTILLIPTATAWHRLVVLGRDHPDAGLSYAFRAADWRYFLRGMALFAAMIGIQLLVFVALGIAYLAFGVRMPSEESVEVRSIAPVLGIVLSLAVLAPRFLVLPAAASGQDRAPAALMARARRAHWPVFAAQMLVFAPWAVVAAGAGNALQGRPVLAIPALALLQFAIIAISLGVLSHAFVAIGGSAGPPAADA
jgi:hypothetical protein